MTTKYFRVETKFKFKIRGSNIYFNFSPLFRRKRIKYSKFFKLLTDANGKSIKSKEKLLVKDLVSFKLTDKVEECEEMSLLASKEMILENSLVAMKAQWEDHTMQAVKHSTTVGHVYIRSILNFVDI